jgi:hypothetical protein
MLAPKVFVTQTVDKEPYNIDFVSTVVDGIECYEIKSKDFHYGYMTEALANKIFETRPGSKDRYVDSFSFETKVKDNQQYLKLKNRIILDLPSKIDEANAFSAFSFYGIKYADDVKKESIFIKSKSGFTLSGVSSEIEFIFPDNKLNCGGFNINDLNKGLTTIEIDAPNGNIQCVNINGFTYSSDKGNDAHLSVTFEKEWGELLINNFYIPTYPGESGYLRIKTGDQLSLVNGGINSDNQKDLDLLLLESSKSIVIHDSHLFFSQTEKYLKDRPFVGISGDGSIHLLYNDCYISGLVQNDQSLEVVAPNPKETYKRYSFFITNSTFKSPVVLSLTKDANSLLVSDTLIDNKGKETTLKGDIRVLGSELTGDGKKKQAITNSSIRWSKLISFGTIKGAAISNAFLEKCKITNRSNASQSQDIVIGSSYYSNLDEKDKYEKTDILHIMKNCEIDIDDDKYFLFNSNIPSQFENCVFKKGYELSNVENNFNLSLLNSLFTDARMELKKTPGSSTDFMTIRNCEFTGSSFFCGVKEIDSSIIENGVKLSNFNKVSDSFLKNITKNGGKKVGRELNDFSSSADPEKAGNFENPVSIFPQKDIEIL